MGGNFIRSALRGRVLITSVGVAAIFSGSKNPWVIGKSFLMKLRRGFELPSVPTEAQAKCPRRECVCVSEKKTLKRTAMTIFRDFFECPKKKEKFP